MVVRRTMWSITGKYWAMPQGLVKVLETHAT